jgi:ATP-dependent exoDNAse (exonuclease V) alpha subunit
VQKVHNIVANKTCHPEFDPPKRLSGVQVYEQEERYFAVGDRVQFTSPWREKHLSNRDIGIITALDRHGNVTVTVDRTGRQVSWNLE